MLTLYFASGASRLGNHEWAVGKYSIADIHLFRLFWRFRGWLNRGPDEFPHLSTLRTGDDAVGGDEDDQDRVDHRLSAARVAITTRHRRGGRPCQPQSARTTGDIRP
jgi:hypothetical protein